MAQATITKIETPINQGRNEIHVYVGKKSYIFGDIGIFERHLNSPAKNNDDTEVMAIVGDLLTVIVAQPNEAAKLAALSTITNRVVTF